MFFHRLLSNNDVFGLVLIGGVLLIPFCCKLDHRVCKLIASMEMFGSQLVIFEHIICKRLYYRFAGDACVSSSLMDTKDKGEGEGRVTFHETCDADIVPSSCRLLLMLLEDQNLLNGEE